MIENKRQLFLYMLFSSVGTALVLWQLLLPGYALLLDWGVGPLNSFLYHDITRYIQAPSYAVMYLLGLLLPMWVVQKLLLVGVVGALFALPLMFYPWAKSAGSQYLASLLAVCNPFVYERLLAGQWRVLLGYAGLFPLTYFLLSYSRTQSRRDALGICATLFFIGCWSIHFLALGSVLVIIYLIVFSWTNRDSKNLWHMLRPLIASIGILLVLSLYWIVPYAVQSTNTQVEFATDDFFAFATTRDAHLGAVGNVLTLHGFWTEDHAWADSFTLAKDRPWLFYPVLLAVLGVVVYGAWPSAARQNNQINRTFLTISFVLSLIFAAGVSVYGLWWINLWLLEHAPFWNGFRDTHKWAAVVALTYALGYGAGAAKLRSHFASWPRPTATLLFAFPLILVPQLWFGFDGQVQPVWYPAAWAQVDTLLQAEPNCKAIFLPWHQYYASDWNAKQLTITPSKSYFDCQLISGSNTELGTVADRPHNIKNYDDITAAITSNSPMPERQQTVINTLRAAGITHIIFAQDIIASDIYQYPFLTSPEVEAIYEHSDVILYRLLP